MTSPFFQVQLSLEDSKIQFNNTLVGITDPNYNEGFTSIHSWPITSMTFLTRGTTSPKGVITIIIQNRISSAVTFI